MKQLNKIMYAVGLSMLTSAVAMAQSPLGTLELPVSPSPLPTGKVVSVAPITAPFYSDLLNGPAATNNQFTPNTPAVNVTVSLANQQFTGLTYGSAAANNTQTTGLVFGASPTLANDNLVTAYGATPENRYALIGSYSGAGGPVATMFTSDPNPGGIAPTGTGFKFTGATTAQNAGIAVFTTAQVLYANSTPINSRVYFGDLVINFSRPVTNPVIHIAGLGGSYRYTPIGSAALIATYFTTELDLVNTGVTSTLLSGNPLIQLNGNNIANANHVNPDGGSFDLGAAGGSPNTYGAATGSIRINGTVQTVTYRVYLQGGSGSDFAWSAPMSAITGANKDPFAGDVWYVAASLAKPIQQISGSVLNDADGLTDNNINQTAGVANGKTNVGNTLYANLLGAGGLIVATTNVSAEGLYVFDNVPVGAYTVQVTVNAGTIGLPAPATALPTGWARTGEHIGTDAGSDGLVDGRSALVTVLANDIITDVNFGIERQPESQDYTTVIPKPVLGSSLILDNAHNMPVLSGSDPEDQPVQTVLTGKTVVITALPTNSVLRYNGANVVLNVPITNFNPALLSFFFNQPTALTQSDFRYAYVDRAGVADPTPALYRVVWIVGGPLPVILTDVTAVNKDCSAIVSWKSTSEVNVSRYEVEVATKNDFVYAGTVNAANSTATHAYDFTYAMQSGVVYYFRIKVIDNDGSFTYSQTVKTNCSGKVQITMAPNPVRDAFRINNMGAGKNTIAIYANDGKLVRTEIATNATKDVNISSFLRGMYVVKIINENGDTFTQKIVKE